MSSLNREMGEAGGLQNANLAGPEVEGVLELGKILTGGDVRRRIGACIGGAMQPVEH